MFDPLGISGISTATWSPLRAAADLRGALAAAQMLARSGGEEGPNDRFWRGQAEQLIAAMLWTAANTEGQSMRSVVKWVLDLDRPGDDRASTLAPLVRLLTDHADPAVALAAKQVQGWLHGQWSTDPRTTSSVYATARNAVWPWADPDVAASADGCDITLDWLLAGNNTLYLCAPLVTRPESGWSSPSSSTTSSPKPSTATTEPAIRSTLGCWYSSMKRPTRPCRSCRSGVRPSPGQGCNW